MSVVHVAPVSACLIVKNEISRIELCLQSLRPYVAQLVVVDTGSTDGTYEIVKKYADVHEVFTECNDSDGRMADFAMARNRSYSHANQPWALWIDGDDVLDNSHLLADIIEKHQGKASAAPFSIMLPYEYSHDEQGNPTLVHYRERLMTPPSAFEWKSPVHEVACCKTHHNSVQIDDMKVVHYRDRSNKVKEPSRNLRILKAHYEKVGDSDIRGLYYLATEYGNNGDIDNAIEYHLRYQKVAWWDDEKFYSAVKLVDHYVAKGEYGSALDWAHNLPKLKENWGESYLHICRVHYFMGHKGGTDERRNWEKCIAFGKIAITVPPAVTVLFANPFELKLDIFRYLNFAYNKCGQVREALEMCERGLSFKATDETLLFNVRLYRQYLARESLDSSIRGLKDHCNLTDSNSSLIKRIGEEPTHIHHLISYGPEESNHSISGKVQDFITGIGIPFTTQSGIMSDPKPVVESVRDEINLSIYVGPGTEEWRPDVIHTSGIGGSETAVIEMTRRLVKKGYKINVYGSGPECEFEGVNYLHPNKWKGVKSDIAITSRRPWMMDEEYGAKFKLSYVWIHDITAGDMDQYRYERIDYFLALSEWHKRFLLSYYQYLDPTRILVTQNGLDFDRFDHKVGRDPYKLVYSSSPDRGLYKLLKAWGQIKARVPQASLSVFYGFKNWEVAASWRNNPTELAQISEIKNMLEKLENQSVSFNGRVDQRTLAREYLSAGVWCYPTWFSETSCITAMEAQAAGLRIVCPHTAALEETVFDRGRILQGHYDDPDYLAQTVNLTVEALLSEDDSERSRNMAHARSNFGWDKVSEEWDFMMRRHLNEMHQNPARIYSKV